VSEEKMREAFLKWFYSEPHRTKYSTDDPALLAAWEAWQAALQESEAGSEVAYKDAPARIWLNLGDCTAEEIAANNAGWNGLTEVTWCESKMDQFDIPYVRADLAPPSSPAIETAAYMRAAEVCDSERVEASDSDEDQAYNRALDHAKSALLTLIPQDGRTELHAKCCAAIANYIIHEQGGVIVPNVADRITGFVTNLIGVPPLSSETSWEGK
jgi:hypothetical protein